MAAQVNELHTALAHIMEVHGVHATLAHVEQRQAELERRLARVEEDQATLRRVMKCMLLNIMQHAPNLSSTSMLLLRQALSESSEVVDAAAGEAEVAAQVQGAPATLTQLIARQVELSRRMDSLEENLGRQQAEMETMCRAVEDMLFNTGQSALDLGENARAP